MFYRSQYSSTHKEPINTIEVLYSDVDKLLSEEQLKEIKIADAVMNINDANVDSVNDLISKSNINENFLDNLYDYSKLVRPTQKKNINKLPINMHKCSDNSSDPQNGVIHTKFTPMRPYNLFFGIPEDTDLTHQKQDGSDDLFDIFINDDVNLYVNLTSEPYYNPDAKIKPNREIMFVNPDAKSVTYMQIMAFYGSVKCFKIAYLNENFNADDIKEYAIAGGNLEIIRILEDKCNYDYCFETALKFHRTNICDWLLKNFKCESNIMPNVLTYNNPRALYFMLLNNLNNTWNFYFDFMVFAIKADNFELFKCAYDKSPIDLRKLPDLLKEAIESCSLKSIKFLVETAKIDIPENSIRIARLKEFNKCSSINKYFDECLCFHLALERSEDISNLPQKYAEIVYDDKTPLYVASQNKQYKELDILINKFHVTNKKCCNVILKEQIEKNDLKQLEYLLDTFTFDLNEKNNERYLKRKNSCLVIYQTSLLSQAVKLNNLEAFKLLIEKGNADINMYYEKRVLYGYDDEDCSQTTVIHDILKKKKNDFFMYLFQKNLINYTNILTEAYLCGNYYVVDLLITKPGVNVEDLFHLAVLHGDTKYMEMAFNICNPKITIIDKYLCGNNLSGQQKSAAVRLFDQLVQIQSTR